MRWSKNTKVELFLKPFWPSSRRKRGLTAQKSDLLENYGMDGVAGFKNARLCFFHYICIMYLNAI